MSKADKYGRVISAKEIFEKIQKDKKLRFEILESVPGSKWTEINRAEKKDEIIIFTIYRFTQRRYSPEVKVRVRPYGS